MVLPCLVLGGYLFLFRKGTPSHRLLGKFYMVLMGCSALLTLFISAETGPTLGGHFGFLHLLSLLTIWSVPRAWVAARQGNMRVHKTAMVMLYLGGLIIAGSFAVFSEGRYLHTLLFR